MCVYGHVCELSVKEFKLRIRGIHLLGIHTFNSTRLRAA